LYAPLQRAERGNDFQPLSEAQIAELFEPPTNQRDLVRHYTLTEADLAVVLRRRGDDNRLGYALMLCLLRYPGRPLRIGERPPAPLLAFVAEQIDVLPACFDDYLAAERTRQRHAVECQEELGLRPFGRRAATELLRSLLEPAIENDQLATLAPQVMQAFRERRIVAPTHLVAWIS
jgi:TnpA family transposase